MHDAHKKLLFPVKTMRVDVEIQSVMFIDPGLQGTGYAYYPTVNVGLNDTYHLPSVMGSFTPKESSRWDGKAEIVCSWFDGFLAGIKPQILVIEFPEVWTTSPRSMSATMRGDLFKLTFLAGGLSEVARRHGCNLPLLISPHRWKGQLTKENIRQRVSELVDASLISDSHCLDAVAMGLAAQGVL